MNAFKKGSKKSKAKTTNTEEVQMDHNAKAIAKPAKLKADRKKPRTTREFLLSQNIGYEDFIIVDGVPVNKPRIWSAMQELLKDGLIVKIDAPKESQVKDGRIFYKKV